MKESTDPTAEGRLEPIFWLSHLPGKEITREYRLINGGARSIIFNCALVRESSVALIVLRRPFSGLDCASRPIQPSSLGGLIAKSVSMNSIGNSFEIALEASVEIPLVIQPEISAEITFETDNGCTTELPGKFKLSKCGVGVVSSPKSTTSSSALGLVDG